MLLFGSNIVGGTYVQEPPINVKKAL